MRNTIERDESRTRYTFTVRTRFSEFSGRAVVEAYPSGDAAWALQTNGSQPDFGGLVETFAEALEHVTQAVEASREQAVKWDQHDAWTQWGEAVDACSGLATFESWYPVRTGG